MSLATFEPILYGEAMQSSVAVHGPADRDTSGQHTETTKDVNISGKREGKKDGGNQALGADQVVCGAGDEGQYAESCNVYSGEVPGGTRARSQADMEQPVSSIEILYM